MLQWYMCGTGTTCHICFSTYICLTHKLWFGQLLLKVNEKCIFFFLENESNSLKNKVKTQLLESVFPPLLLVHFPQKMYKFQTRRYHNQFPSFEDEEAFVSVDLVKYPPLIREYSRGTPTPKTDNVCELLNRFN
jgi:hypothetical protein